MKSSLHFLAAFGIVALLGAGCSQTTQPTPPKPPAVTVPVASSVYEFKTVTTRKGETDALRNMKVESVGGKLAQPLKITGEARLWYFEAVFPVELRNSNGHLIGNGQAQAKGDWMTEGWVPFEVQFAFPEQEPGAPGTIVLMNDNPSGLERNADSFEIPVTF